MPEATPPMEKKSFLDWIERVGNKMPHPMLLFAYLILMVIVLSALFSAIGTTLINPSNGEQVKAFNLLSTDGLMFWARTFISNYQGFPVLAIVLILGIATGICEITGFFSTAIKMSLSNVKGSHLAYFVSLIGMFGAEIGDASMILIPTLAGALFYSTGRNPITGILCAYAAACTSFGVQIIPGGFDPILTALTNSAAQMLNPDFNMPLMSGYYLLFAAALIIPITNTIITVKIIEPKLGVYTGTPEDIEEKGELTQQEKSAVKRAGLAMLIYLALIFISCVPSNSFFRNPENGSLIIGAPLMASLQTIVVFFFFIPGLVYGISTKKITGTKDLFDMMVASMKGLAGFAVLGIVIGQFLALFAKSNLGTLLSLAGGDALKTANMPFQVIALVFFIFVVFINLFIISGSTKYLMFAPIFVPMFMQLGLHPALVQVVYKIGDGMTNSLSPLNSMFIVLLALCNKYDKKVGIGTIFSSMLPFSIANTIVMAIIILIWITLRLPLGIGGGIFL